MNIPPERRKLVDEATKALNDRGLLVEAGFAAFRILYLEGAPPEVVAQMRLAFFVGAQHLWGSIPGSLDADAEPTESDLRRMDLIDAELKAFIETLKPKT